MAKATKASETKKSAPKAAPAKAKTDGKSKTAAKPAKAEAAPAKASRPEAPAKVAPAPAPAPAKAKPDAARALGVKANPEAGAIRAHPDAKLNKGELQSLYQKLVDEKARVVSGFDRHVQEALSDDDVLADEIDIAQRSTDQAWLFRFADKERKLLIEIEAALEKMRSGEYGICEGTDEPIGFKRLELRPWTRYSVAYKEMLEREKAQQAR